MLRQITAAFLWKLTGIFLVAAGTAGAGLCICRDRRSRILQLTALGHAFSMIAGEISYSRISLPEIFREVGEKMYGAERQRLGRCLLEIAGRLQEGSGQDIRRVWQEEMGTYLSASKLEKPEKTLVLSFPDAVWFLDGPRQEAAVIGFADELQKRAEEAQQRRSQEDRMTMAFYLATGAMAAILLL